MNYLAIDGDNIGLLLEKSLLSNNEIEIRAISEKIKKEIDRIAQHLSERGYKMLICAGDNILCKAKAIDPHHIVSLLESSSIPFSAGIGSSLRSVFLSLRYAKATGKGKLVIARKTKLVELINIHAGIMNVIKE